MARNKKAVTQITVVVPIGQEDVIKEVAKAKGFNVSEYIRALIERDNDDHPNLDLEVEHRGGYRPRQHNLPTSA